MSFAYRFGCDSLGCIDAADLVKEINGLAAGGVSGACVVRDRLAGVASAALGLERVQAAVMEAGRRLGAGWGRDAAAVLVVRWAVSFRAALLDLLADIFRPGVAISDGVFNLLIDTAIRDANKNYFKEVK